VIHRLIVSFVFWLGSLMVERRTRDHEVAGSSLTHCTADYSPWETALTRAIVTKQYDSVPAERVAMIYGRAGNRRSGVALVMRHTETSIRPRKSSHRQ